MPSLSSKTKTKRKNRRKAMGKARKRLARHGSTPAFPIHLDGREGTATPKKQPEKKQPEKKD